MMFTVTEKAQEEVRNQLEGKETMPIRVFLNSGGCGGPQMTMALDEKNTDSIFTFDEVDYLVDKEFLEQAQPICADVSPAAAQVPPAHRKTGLLPDRPFFVLIPMLSSVHTRSE